MRFRHVIILCLLLSACQSSEPKTEGDIKIGGLLALTGAGSPWGNAERDAIELAFEEANDAGGVNGRKLKLVVEDTQTEPEKAVAAYQKLRTINQLKILFGPTWEDSSAAVIPLAAQDGILVLAPSSYQTIETMNSSHLFSTYPPFRYQISTFAPLFEQLKATRFVIIYNEAFYPQTMADLFEAQATIQGWTIVERLHAPIGTADYRTMILKLEELQPIDGVYLLLWDPDIGVMLKQANELGIEFTAYGVEADENQNLLENYGPYMENLIYPFPKESETYKNFEIAYDRRYGKKPASSSAASAYDAANLLIQALQSGAETPLEIAEYLHTVQNFEGASGIISFDERGIIGEKEYVMKTVRNGAFVDY